MHSLREKFELPLIVPGEVEVDLANFDIKFQTKFLCIGLKTKYLLLQISFPNLFELLR
jgi:hypothetical protein